MSGPSSEQLQLQQEQMDFYKAGQAHADATFKEQQGLLKQMQAVYSPILSKGPGQRGFSDAERNELNAQTVQGTATNYGHAARAVGEQVATRGGGDNPLPSGSEAELKQQVAMSAAEEQSREQGQIISADYAEGRQNFSEAGRNLLSASGQMAPSEYYRAATEAGSSAENTANQINQEQNSWLAPVMGAVGALAGAAGTAYAGR